MRNILDDALLRFLVFANTLTVIAGVSFLINNAA